MTSKLAQNLKQPALDFLSFVNASPTRIVPLLVAPVFCLHS